MAALLAEGLSNGAIIAIVSVFAGLVLAAILIFVWRYKTCPPDKIMVVYGSMLGKHPDGTSKSAVCIHGGGAFVWPFVQNVEYLDLNPIKVQMIQKEYPEGMPIDRPLRCTVAISAESGEDMERAAERFLGQSAGEVEKFVKERFGDAVRAAYHEEGDSSADANKFLISVKKWSVTQFSECGMKVVSVAYKKRPEEKFAPVKTEVGKTVEPVTDSSAEI